MVSWDESIKWKDQKLNVSQKTKFTKIASIKTSLPLSKLNVMNIDPNSIFKYLYKVPHIKDTCTFLGSYINLWVSLSPISIHFYEFSFLTDIGHLISSLNLIMYYLISLRSRYLMQFPSTLISPWCISTIRNRARNRLDLPDPVLPTMPTFSLGWVQNVTPHRASDRSLLYLRYTFLKETTPMVGQNGETYNNMKNMTLIITYLEWV